MKFLLTITIAILCLQATVLGRDIDDDDFDIYNPNQETKVNLNEVQKQALAEEDDEEKEEKIDREVKITEKNIEEIIMMGLKFVPEPL